jgi:hypothetical protein
MLGLWSNVIKLKPGGGVTTVLPGPSEEELTSDVFDHPVRPQLKFFECQLQDLAIKFVRMMADRLPIVLKEQKEAWMNPDLSCTCAAILHFLPAMRVCAMPTGLADVHPANVTVAELRASNHILSLFGPGPAESPDKVVLRGLSPRSGHQVA